MPSAHVCSNFVPPACPQFLNQAPPRTQQLRFPDFLTMPHWEHPPLLTACPLVVAGISALNNITDTGTNAANIRTMLRSIQMPRTHTGSNGRRSLYTRNITSDRRARQSAKATRAGFIRCCRYTTRMACLADIDNVRSFVPTRHSATLSHSTTYLRKPQCHRPMCD